MKFKGYTIIEILVASVIGVFIAGVMLGMLKTTTTGSERIGKSISTSSELRFAADMIQTDLVNFYRQKEFQNTKFVSRWNETASGVGSMLSFYTIGRAKARAMEPEGDVYEVRYFLVYNQEKQTSSLVRQLWPNPDKESKAGGLLTVIAEDVGIFVARFFDGQQWQTEWPEEMQKTPDLVEVMVAANSGTGEKAAETFMVNLVRNGQVEFDMDSTNGLSSSGDRGEGI